MNFIVPTNVETILIKLSKRPFVYKNIIDCYPSHFAIFGPKNKFYIIKINSKRCNKNAKHN